MAGEILPPQEGAPNGASIDVYRQREIVFSSTLTDAIEIGRQCLGEPPPYCRVSTSSRARIVIAPIHESSLSRKHALLERLEGNRIRATNLSGSQAIGLGGEARLRPGEQCELEFPASLSLGDRVICIDRPKTERLNLETLASPTPSPGQGLRQSALFSNLLSRMDSADRMARCLPSIMQLLQEAATSHEFLPRAATAMADVVALDSALVLVSKSGDWEIAAARHAPSVEEGSVRRPSRTMLSRVLAERRTFRHVPDHRGQVDDSLKLVSSLVAAPILNRAGEVIGVLYGDRKQGRALAGAEQISELDAMLVELLACGVSAGLARLEEERKALAARVRFEQFFSTELAQRLEAEPDLLAGRDAEVTVLFCDIRGFSRVSERIGPAGTIAWVNDVMGALSECVVAEGGVLVDYVGDELMAMWGAPAEQPDQARRACRAALDMFKQLPLLNERWQREIGEPLAIGVGINSGPARVGNTGSNRKFKYGPLGNTVNLASRVQGATKHVKARLLITGATAAQLDESFAMRRLCNVRVVNIRRPVALYELVAEPDTVWQRLKREYESALCAFESGDLRAASKTLGALLESHPEDGPTLGLVSRAVSALANSDSEFDPTWELASK